MIDKISKKILSILSTNNNSEEEKEILLFGITRIVEDIPKTIGIILIGILLDIIKEMAVVTIVIMLYKTFVGGVHAKTNLGCFMYSALFYLAIIYSAKYLAFTGMYKLLTYILIYIFAVYCILVYAPADVPEIPKVNVKLRKTLKIKSLVMLNLIYIVSLLVIKNVNYQTIIIYSVFYISIMTTRTMYKIFKAEYGYETYIPDELI